MISRSEDVVSVCRGNCPKLLAKVCHQVSTGSGGERSHSPQSFSLGLWCAFIIQEPFSTVYSVRMNPNVNETLAWSLVGSKLVNR
jgi:hypothetical protein